MGVACPLGLGAENVWKRLIAGESGISVIESFNVEDLPAKIAGQIPRGPKAEGKLDLAEWVPPKDHRKMDRFIQYALVAGAMAVEDSGWQPEEEADRCATGVMIGSGIGGLETIYEASVLVHEGRARRLSPFFIPSALINLASGQLSIKYGFKGPNHSVVTACATGVHALGDAARLIVLGDADVMVAGGTESAVNPLGIAGFCASRALSTGFNDTPTKASRPWDRDRDGFVMGEGSGVVVLEELEHAKRRGAKIYAEVCGYGMSGDAYHITAPAEGHEGAFRAMTAALKNGQIRTDQIQYVNAHGTSTPLGDDLELEAVERLFGDAAKGLAMSSTKSATGHLLGAAGAIEAIFSVLAVRDNVAPPTLNLDNPSRESVIDRVAHTAQQRRIDVALSNSFGFGGTNASILFRKAP
jgi:3-oxoacyl-[acyl-carrier-protein] synthase II